MIAINCPTNTTNTAFTDNVQAEFVYHLPRIENHAKYALRHVGCEDTRDELIAEIIALAWKHFVSLTQRGKNPETFITTLALRCSQAARSGRRLAGSDSAVDVLSRIAMARHGFRVDRLSRRVPVPHPRPAGPVNEGVIAEALLTDPKARVPDQAAFRIDFPAWRSRFRDRDRAVLDALACGDRPSEVAEQFGISFGRVSQLRAAFAANWAAFHQNEE